MASIWSRSPFTELFILWQLIRLPFILFFSLRFIFRPLRPVPQWSLMTTFTNLMMRQYFVFLAATRVNQFNMVLLDQKQAKERFSRANPPENDDIYTGILTPGTVKPAPVGGIWFPEPVSSGPAGDEGGNEKVAIHFVGGAFVLAFGSQFMGQIASDGLTRYLGVSKVLIAQYRPSSDNETRFPAAIQDLVTFYNHVLSLGVKPENIIISGDSAGGNLVIGLLRYLEETEVLPLPSAVMVWSPWVHVTEQAGKDYTQSKNSHIDVLDPSILQWGVEAYWPDGGASRQAIQYISPLHHPFSTSVPLFIHACKSEAFYDTIREFADEMIGVNGKRVRFHSTEFASHNLILSYEGLDMAVQLKKAMVDARELFGLGTTKKIE